MIESFLSALLLGAGFNAAVVSLGAAALGAAAGGIGVYVLLRRRALVSDAISHATLPGLALAFIAGVLIFGNGRMLPLLLLGAAGSALIGVLCVEAIAARTRLAEDTAIGAVLSTFFALGVVLLTVIQSMPTAGQAGLETFLLGATAGMLRSEAELIAVGAVVVGAVVFAFRRPFAMVCFDEGYAAVRGLNVRLVDRAMLGLLLAVIVIGLKVVGLVLIIALAIIPPVAARFWSDRVSTVVVVASVLGALGAYIGAALSASAPRLPTGAVIVLVLFSLFVVSFLVAPARGLVAAALAHQRFRRAVHLRQGLLALARGEPVFDPLSRRLLRRAGFIAGDGVATQNGQSMAHRIARDQALWNRYRDDYPEDAVALPEWSLRPIEEVLPVDMVADLERRVGTGSAAA
jgi:manganese/zinc/iron transport system permease protein